MPKTKKLTEDQLMVPQKSELDVVEEAGIAFNPETQFIDLSKEEKRRTTSLLMAIQAYRELIIKDADYLREASNLAERNKGPAIQPATIDAMLDAALKFDLFISGKLEESAKEELEEIAKGGESAEG